MFLPIPDMRGMTAKSAQIVDEIAPAWHTFVALLGRSLAVERLTLDQVGGVRIPAPQPFFFPH
jgi:hypothetical protein